MRLWPRPVRDESWKQMHRRMIQETEQYLSECLRHPELAVRIPAIPAGSGRFPRSMTTAFWSKVLDE